MANRYKSPVQKAYERAVPQITLPATLKPFADKIRDIDRDSDGCWFIGLKHGWYCPETETHLISEIRLRDIAAKLRGVVRCSAETCDMKECA
jgi:hypothetical protein